MLLPKGYSDKDLDALLVAIEHEEKNRWIFFKPNPKQREFMDLGAKALERLLHAGNQTGKSHGGAYEVSRHLTGIYPPWWKGLRFDHPTKIWAAGPSGMTVRDTIQEKLLGNTQVDELLGTGFIPRDAIVGSPTASRSATGAVDTVMVRHATGGISTLTFKTYEQDRRHWQGATLDFLWFDEEPPLELYIEGQARLFQTGSHSMITFTPLMGMTDVVRRYFEDPTKTRRRVQMGFDDCPYITKQMERNILSIYPECEWPARRNGDPYFTEGRVFSTPWEGLLEPAWSLGVGHSGLQLPGQWPRLWGVDFGGGQHPFAAVLMGFDRELDTAHVLAGIRLHSPLALEHADAIKRIAANVPIAWPHDGHVRDAAGEERAIMYRRQYGLNMLGEHATHPTGGFSTEFGLHEMEQYMRGGRFKVNNTMTEWGQEYRLYHRDNKGALVKIADDYMSATRIAFMARRHAQAVPLGTKRIIPRYRMTGQDFDPWTGKPI